MDCFERGRQLRRGSQIRVAHAALLAIAVACTRPPRPAARAELLPRPLPQCGALPRVLPLDSTASSPGALPTEDTFLRVSRTVPGGFTRLEQGRNALLAIKMVDTAYADTVRTALLSAARERGEKSDGSALRKAELIAVPFSLATLVDWNTYLFRRVMDGAAREGVSVSSVGVNAHLDRVEIAVPTEAARVRMEEWLGQVDTPCGLVVTKIEGAPGVYPAVRTIRK